MRVRSFLPWAVGAVCMVCGVEGRTDVTLPAGASHVLVQEGDVRCEIVVGQKAGPVALFAARELQSFLSQSFGRNVPLRGEPSGTNTALFVGAGEAQAAARVDLNQLPRDGFVIKSCGPHILIAGVDDMTIQPEREMGVLRDVFDKGGLQYERASLFGVYEFLERFLGVRFYFPGVMGTVVPRHDSLALPALDLVRHPVFPVRKIGTSGIVPDGGASYDPASIRYKHLNHLRLRTQTEYIPNCHGLAHLDFIRRFGKSHPEYFALMDNGERHNRPSLQHAGHLCFSSGIREEIYRDAEVLLSGKSAESRDIRRKDGSFGWAGTSCQPGYFNVMPQDGLYPCHCAACQVHFKGLRYRDLDSASTSEFIWGLVCEVADRLKSNGIPGKVTAMAYSAYASVPARPIPDNVEVMVALRGPWNVALPEAFEKERELTADWHAKLGRKVWFWNYAGKSGELSMPDIPCVTPRTIARYYQAMAPHIIGAYMSSPTDRFLFQYLNYYVFSKVCWDTSLDIEALLKEHHQVLFGAAAPFMASVYDRLEENWVKRVFGNPVETDLGPSAIPPSDFELWEKVYSAAEVERLTAWFDQAEAAVASDPEPRERVRFMRRQMFEPLVARRAQYERNKQELADLSAHAAPLPAGEAPVMDGALDEPLWAATEPLYLRPFPDREDGGAFPATTVRVRRDAATLYVAFDCEEPAPADQVAALRERDDRGLFRESSVELFLNPTGDRKRYFQILVNSKGSIADAGGIKTGAEQTLDWAWTSGATVGVREGSNAWTAELSIPLTKLPGLGADGCPANFARNRASRTAPIARFTWSPFLQQGYHEIEKFGRLSFAAPMETNQVRNGDFTAPVKGTAFGGWWVHPGNGTNTCAWSIDPARFVTGGKSLRLTGSGGDRIAVKQHLPELKPNTEYLLTFYIRAERLVPSRHTGGAMVSVWDEANRYFPSNPYTGTMPWTKQGFTFRTSPEVNKQQRSYISLILRDAAGAVWFDDVRVREVGRSDPSQGSAVDE